MIFLSKNTVRDKVGEFSNDCSPIHGAVHKYDDKPQKMSFSIHYIFFSYLETIKDNVFYALMLVIFL